MNFAALLVVIAIITVLLAMFVSAHIAVVFLVVAGLCLALVILVGRGGGRPLV